VGEGVAAKWACKMGVAHAAVAGLGRQVGPAERRKSISLILFPMNSEVEINSRTIVRGVRKI
jgi:hypothetical protein